MCLCCFKKGSKASEESLAEYMKQRFVKYKIPDTIMILNELPVTPSGKISKLKLKEKIEQQRGF